MDALIHSHTWKPLARLGLTHPFFELTSTTIIYTWVALALIIALCLAVRYVITQYPQTVVGYAIRSTFDTFIQMVIQATDQLIPRYFFFITALFIFIFFCNCLILIPGLEEPTRDLNTTLALALISFLYAQKETIKAHGLLGFIGEYMKMPFTLVPHKKYPILITFFLIGMRAIMNLIMGILSLPLELMSKGASIISLSFRLFGNILAGSLITTLARQAVAGSFLLQLTVTFLGVNLLIALFFGIFESFIQAYVFAMLSLTYIVMGTTHQPKDIHE
ncbi:MAG: FoF1 ATP synthase subunit a [Candidatus Babeliaceae bacterium]